MLMQSADDRSSEVDIAVQSSLAGASQKLQQVGTFRLTRAAANQDDQTRKRNRVVDGLFSQSHEMCAIATDDDQSLLSGITEGLFIQRCDRQRLFKQSDLMSPVPEQLGRFHWHVMIQKESHVPGWAICSATSALKIGRAHV